MYRRFVKSQMFLVLDHSHLRFEDVHAHTCPRLRMGTQHLFVIASSHKIRTLIVIHIHPLPACLFRLQSFAAGATQTWATTVSLNSHQTNANDCR